MGQTSNHFVVRSLIAVIVKSSGAKFMGVIEKEFGGYESAICVRICGFLKLYSSFGCVVM